MKAPIALLAVAIATASLSCGIAPPAQRTNATPQTPTGMPETSGLRGAPLGPALSSSSPRTEGDAPPVGARFHLFCESIDGPNHVLRATRRKAQLIEATGEHAWHIIHTDKESSIFFGYYRTFSMDDPLPDAREVARARADLHRLSELTTQQGDKVFHGLLFQPIGDADPNNGLPQWNLANAPANAYWSLQVAAYRGDPQPGSPDRKTAAVDAVRAMRAAGIEAYYYHGEQVSSVCVGAWPVTAVKKQESDRGLAARDMDVRTMVVDSPVPNNIDPNIVDKEGHRVILQAPKLEVLDPTMLAAIHQFPDHALNGAVYGTPTKGGGVIKDSSFLVLVPHTQASPEPVVQSGNGGVNDRTSAVDQAAADAILNPEPAARPTPGRGRLPSIDHP